MSFVPDQDATASAEFVAEKCASFRVIIGKAKEEKSNADMHASDSKLCSILTVWEIFSEPNFAKSSEILFETAQTATPNASLFAKAVADLYVTAYVAICAKSGKAFSKVHCAYTGCSSYYSIDCNERRGGFTAITYST